MISSVVGNKVLDWHWKKLGTDRYKFYIGDIFIGQVFNMGVHGWTGLHREPNIIGLCEGFKTRYDASHFLLKFEKDIRY